MMRTFIDVTIRRIHTYLARSTRLRSVRGASSVLATATDDMVVMEILRRLKLQQCARVCVEAGRSESVIHIEFACECGTCDPESTPEQIESALIAWMREAVPAADFEVVRGTGVSYTEFVLSGKDTSRACFAPAIEIPFLVTCGLCRVDIAVIERNIVGERVRVCVDCDRREEFGRRNSTESDLGSTTILSAAHRLQTRLQDSPHKLPTRIADDLADLAFAGPADRPGVDPESATNGQRKRNHIAVVYIDGNGFRSMFSGAARQAGNGFDVGQLSSELSSVVWESLTGAAAVVQQRSMKASSRPAGGRHVLVVEPVLAAADDLCVFLPAAYAWEFVVEYCSRFAERATDLVVNAGSQWSPTGRVDQAAGPDRSSVVGDDRRQLLLTEVPPPSASAAIVIGQYAEPFARLLDLAEELLASAKRAVAGRAPTVLWCDVTRDGYGIPTGRRPILLPGGRIAEVAVDECILLDESTVSRLDALAELNSSIRKRLERQAAGDDGVLAAASVRDTARRNGLLRQRSQPIARFLEDTRLRVDELADLLSIAEWWR